MRHGRILCYTLLSGKFWGGEILDILAFEDSNIQSQPGEKNKAIINSKRNRKLKKEGQVIIV